MKKACMAAVAALALLAAYGTVSADQYVNGYYRGDGTYVEGYYRTDPNNTTEDNYSHYGNVNPYTGQRGYQR